jgi:tetratricopeptide (TPR) repeat protein
MMQIFIPAPLVFIAHALVHRTRQTPWRIFAACAVIVAMYFGVSASRRIDLEQVFAPRYPQIGHTNLAIAYQFRGDLDRAQTHYERALALVPNYAPALKGMGAIAAARGNLSGALRSFERYLAQEPGDEQIRATVEALRRPAVVLAPKPSSIPAPPSDRSQSAGSEVAAPTETSLEPTPLEVARQSPPDAEVPKREETAQSQPMPVEAKAPEVTPSDRVARREGPLEPIPAELKAVPSFVPTQIPVPPKPFAITGPRSDYETGSRQWYYGDVVEVLRRMRAGFSATGGHSVMDADVRFHDLADLLRYLPRAVANVLLAPYPWQWFDIGGSTGPFRALSVVETLLLYAVLVPLLVGLGTAVWRGSPDGLFVAVFVVAQTVVLGLVVNNLGTLFRLRLESLLPLFTAAGLAWAWLFRGRERQS